MGVSRLLLGGRKCERGMSIALIVSNPQRSEATSARRQGKAKSSMQGEGGVSVACLRAMWCRYNSSTTTTCEVNIYVFVVLVTGILEEGGARSIFHNI